MRDSSAMEPNQPNPLLGQILIKLGRLSEAQLQEALDIQATQSESDRKPLGQILLEHDYVQPNDLIEAIKIQIHYRRGGNVSVN